MTTPTTPFLLPVLQGWSYSTPPKLVSTAKLITTDDNGKLTAKTRTKGHAVNYRATELAVTDFASLCEALDLAASMHGGIVHGSILPGIDREFMGRRKSDGGPDKNGTPRPQTIEDRPYPYLVVDIDSLPLPEGLEILSDPDACLQFVADALPACLNGASFWYQWSSRAGLVPGVAKIHLVFLVESPTHGEDDVRRWAKHTNETGAAQIDAAVYSANSITYLAAPDVSPGLKDPFEGVGRCGVFRGERDSIVLDVPPIEFKTKADGRTNRAQQGGDRVFTGVGVTGIAGWLKKIGSTDGLHGPIVGCIKSAVYRHGNGLNREALKGRIITTVRKAVAAGELPGRDADYIEKELSDLDRTIDWALDLRRTELLKAEYGVPAPSYETPDEAKVALDEALTGLFVRADRWFEQTLDAGTVRQIHAEKAAKLKDAAKVARNRVTGIKATIRDAKAKGEAKEWLDALVEGLDEAEAELEGLCAKQAALAAVVPPSDTAPLLAVRATTGTGKTDGTVKRLLSTWQRSVCYFAPTHDVLEDIKTTVERYQAKTFSNDRLKTFHVYGRTHKDKVTGAYTMCERGETAAHLQAEGGDVVKTLCGSDDAPLCPHYETCPFIQQSRALKEAKDSTDRCLYLLATDTLPHWLPGGVRDPDLVIIDESFWQSLVSVAYATPASKFDKPSRGLAALGLGNMMMWQGDVLDAVKDDDDVIIDQVINAELTAELRDLWSQLTDSFKGLSDGLAPGGWFKVSDFAMASDDVARLRKLVVKCKRDVELVVKPGMSDQRIKKALEKIAANNEAVRVYRAMLDALLLEQAKSPDTLSGAVALVEGHVTFRRSLEPRAIASTPEKRAEIPTVFLDADLDPAFVRRWWPHLKDEDCVDITCPWSEHVKVVQIVEPSFSKHWLISGEHAEKHRADVARFIKWQMRARGASPAETMVISYKDAVSGLSETGDEVFNGPSSGWFNAIAGMNTWSDVKLGFVMGRPQANVSAYSDLARGVWAAEDRTWIEVEADDAGRVAMPKELRRVHTRDGSVEAVKTAVHPDPMIDSVYRAITWGQPMQADGRVRPVYRGAENPCTLFVLGDIPRQCKIDEVVRWEDIAITDFDEAVLRAWLCGGVCPASDAGLAAFAPDLWKDADVVKKARRQQGEGENGLIPLADLLRQSFAKVSASMVPSCYRDINSRKGPLKSLDLTPGELRRVGQKGGKAVPFFRLHRNHDLATAIFRVFGFDVSVVRVSTGEWIGIDDLPVESSLPTVLARQLKADLAEIFHGVQQPESWDRLDPSTAEEDAELDRWHTEALAMFDSGNPAAGWKILGEAMTR